MQIMGYDYYDFPITSSSLDRADKTYTTTFTNEGQRKKAEFEITFPDGSVGYYTPIQFHFHTPSEHTVDGKNYDLEVHFVHYIKNDDANGAPLLGAVLGVFFDTKVADGTENAFLKSYMEAVAVQGKNVAANSVPVREFFNQIDMTDYWSYPGSLTTPPCSEGIKWSVVKEVQSLSVEQLAIFKDNMGERGNNRVVMDLNERTLYYSGAANIIAGLGAATFAVAALAF